MANLIGQFEKVKAATTPTVPIIPRTSSVTSHRTGDSALEEVKEKREWPPKSAPPPVAVDHAPSVSPIPDPPKESAVVDTPSDSSPSDSSPLENVIESIPPVQITPPTPATPTPVIVTVDQNVPVATKSKPETTKTVVKTTPRVASNNASTASKTSIKTTPSKVAKTAPALAKSGGRTSISTPVRTPVKSTGTPRNTTSSPLVSTPIRAKSPSEVSTRSPLTRPKTPSHLYTPTAASLARSRNNAPPPPVEKPKRKLTTDLTKPTAASASRMRSIATPTTISRSPKAAPVTKPTIKPSTPASKVVGAIRSTIVKTPSRPTTAKVAQSNSTETHNSEAGIPAQPGSDVSLVHGSPEAEAETGDDGMEEQHSKEKEEIENYDNDFADEFHAPVDEPERVDDNLSGIHVR